MKVYDILYGVVVVSCIMAGVYAPHLAMSIWHGIAALVSVVLHLSFKGLASSMKKRLYASEHINDIVSDTAVTWAEQNNIELDVLSIDRKVFDNALALAVAYSLRETYMEKAANEEEEVV